VTIRYKILIVDEIFVRRSIKLLLERDGHYVFDVGCDTKALEVLAKQDIDVVIADRLVLGIGLINQIRRQRPTLPIIVCTAVDNNVDLAPSENVNVLPKPFSAELLRQGLAQAIGERNLKPKVKPYNSEISQP